MADTSKPIKLKPFDAAIFSIKELKTDNDWYTLNKEEKILSINIYLLKRELKIKNYIMKDILNHYNIRNKSNNYINTKNSLGNRHKVLICDNKLWRWNDKVSVETRIELGYVCRAYIHI